MIKCPLCEGAPIFAFSKYGFDILDCSKCRHRFCSLPEQEPHVHTEKHYGDEYFNGGGAGYANYLDEGRLLRKHGRRYGKILAQRIKPGNVLDIGSAAGFFLQGLTDQGWKGKGIEPNGKMALHARQELGIHVDEGAFESYQTDEKFDLVTMVQVIAHFLNPLEAVRKAAGHLKPRGHLLIETWNRSSWTAKLFGKNWHEYSPPTVLQWFDLKGLQELAEKSSLVQVGHGRPSKWLDGAHAKSLLGHMLQGSKARFTLPLLKAIPNAMPIPYPSEDLVWMLFKKEDRMP